MTPPRNFSMVFTEAQRHGLRLNTLSQRPDGVWHAAWRRDGPADETWFSSAVAEASPLAALTRALDVAVEKLTTLQVDDLGLFG